jgi:hypothetical protein
MKNLPFVRVCFNIFIFLMLTQSVFAQNNKRHFQADYDAKAMRFGYFLGLSNTYFNAKFNNLWSENGWFSQFSFE